MKPTATVGVCVRNCEATIKEVINSIINQNFPHELMEVIFVDDGSEDKTLSVILSTISAINIQTKVFHTERKGLGPVRNTVVDNASGNYIIWVDGDMTISKDFVQKQVEFMEKNPNVGIAKGKYGAIASKNLVAYLENVSWQVEDHKNRENMLPGAGGSIYRVEALKQVGGFDSRFTGAGEDIEAAYRIRAAGWLIFRTQAEFYESRKTTWKALWDEKFWKGYGLHRAFHEHYDIDRIYEIVPPIGFLAGLLRSFVAYELTRQKRVFLLPLHSFFVKTALCSGFMKSHIDSYGHLK